MNEIVRHLQKESVQKNLGRRMLIKKAVRLFMEKRDFKEYDTPVLMPFYGERYNPTFRLSIEDMELGLADSPQVYKMMLSLAGFSEYYQFAHCFRPISNCENRKNRTREFTQIDVELQTDTLDELIAFAQEMLACICEAVSVKPQVCFMDGIACRETYGYEMKPDLRKNKDEFSIVFVKHMPLTNGEKTEEGILIPCHHIFALPMGEVVSESEDELNMMQTESFDMIINGIEVGGGDLRIQNRALQEKMMDIFQVEKEKYRDYLEMLDKYNGKQCGGFAIGIERLLMALSGCEDICDTLCFPENIKKKPIG